MSAKNTKKRINIADLHEISAQMDAKLSISTQPRIFKISIDGLPNVEFAKLRDAYDYLSVTCEHGIEYWHRVTRATEEAIERRERRRHPAGYFDKAGRFFLEERRECCANVKSPSRAWPYLEMQHGRSLVHVASVYSIDVKHLRERVREIDQSQDLTRSAA